MKQLKKDILDLITAIHTDGRFDDETWARICRNIAALTNEWKESGAVPSSLVPFLTDLASQLAGGSRYVDDETAEKIEDASIYLSEELMTPLLTEEDYEL